jgi:hemolysin activation/secretion protein
VFEGRVERLKVTGARYYSQGYIREKVTEFAEGSVPEFTAVQQQLGDLARAQDRRITPVLKPGQVPGMVDVELKVGDKLPLHGGVELNNRYTPNTEPLRLSGYLRYDNLWQREHSLSMQVLVSPQDLSQIRVFSATYVMPAGPGKNVLAFYGVRSRSDVPVVANNLAIAGRGSILGARYIIPLRPTTTVNHSFTLGVDRKDFTDSVTLSGADTTVSPISYTPFTAQYNVAKAGERGVTRGMVAANFTMRGMFGNSDTEFASRRFNALSNYFYLRAELSREQALPKQFSVFGRILGQTASQPLISTEQFFAGGVDTVRGYLEAEALGDNALALRIEVRAPSFAEWIGKGVTEAIALTFLDAAETRILDPLPGQQGKVLLSSAGVGLRAKGPDNLSASLDLGFPFRSTQWTQAGDPRLQFRVAYDF